MRFFSTPSLEAYEEGILASQFGRRYAPTGEVSIGPDAVFRTSGISLVELQDETLAIAPDTASWAFLDKTETARFQSLDGHSFASVVRDWPGTSVGNAANFTSRLFRRGLLQINGQSSVQPDLLRDSPNFEEPNLVELLLTEKCNLACGYCLAGASPNMPAMTPEIARRTIDLAYGMEESQALGFEFSGGEPFMKFQLMRELVDYILKHPKRRGRPVDLMIQTNCTLLTEERVRWIKENDIQVGISLDGNPHSQNKSRPMVNGSQSFVRLLDGIDLLQKFNVPFGALVVLNQSNIGSVEELVDFLLDNGIESFKLNPVAYIGTARGNWDSVGLRQEEVIDYFKRFAELIAANHYHLLESNLRTMFDFLTSKQRRNRCLRTHCGAGDTFQAVAASGDIYPCGRATQTPALKLGNVLDVKLESLSAPGRQHPLVAEIRGRRPSGLEGCESCFYRQLCQAGCSAQAFERYGTVRHRTPECSFFKTMYPYLMRWLAFDRPSFEALKYAGYLSSDAILFENNYAAASHQFAAHV